MEKSADKSGTLVLAIIVNWNCSEDTLRAGQALTDMGLDLVVVDNNSTELGEVQRLSTALQAARILKLPENVGYAGGVNAGMQLGLESGYSHALLLNPDTLPTQSVVESMVGLAADASIVGTAQVSEVDGRWTSYVSAAILDGRKPRPFQCRTACGAGHSVDIVSGAALLINLADAASIGFMDESFFHYKEEYDFCYRAKAKGMKILYSCSPALKHERGGSLPGASPRAQYFKYRNEISFLQKTFGPFGWVSGLGIFRDAAALAWSRPRLTPHLLRGLVHGLARVSGPAEDRGNP